MRLKQVTPAESTLDLGDFERRAFAVEVNAKTFDILFSGLYSNKVRAVIRELTTNAFDAHVQAGCADRPFTITLPTAFSPTFTVRDYGCSMDHDLVMNLYTTVFASTKDNTDDLVGALGLGSKSPFAYTDSFSITCWLNNERRVYVAGMENGRPVITHLLTEPSDEETGVEISFAVSADDFNRFASEAESVARGFDVEPLLSGKQLPPQQIAFRGDGWRVIKDEPHGVRQGCVIYPLMSYQLRTRTGLTHGFGLVVDVPIGTAQVAANREALSFDDETIANVTAAFIRATDELLAAIEHHVTAAPNRLEATRRYAAMREMLAQWPTIRYNDRPLDGFIRITNGVIPRLLTAQEKRVENLALHVNKLPAVRVLIDRSSVDIPRRRRRFYAWRKHEQNLDTLFIMRDPTQDELKTLIRRWDLKPAQLLHLENLPDPGIERPAPRPRSAADRDVGGVVILERGRFVHPTAVPAQFLWAPVVSKTSRTVTCEVLGTRDRHEMTNILVVMQNAGLLVADEQVLFLTSGAQKRLKVDDSTNLWKVLIRRAVAAHPNLLEQERLVGLRNAVRTRASLPLDTEAMDLICADDSPAISQVQCSTTDYLVRQLVFAGTKGDPYLAAVSANERAAEIAERYPLLFGEDAQGVLEYIKLTREQ